MSIQRYVITSYIPNTMIDTGFCRALKNYCNHNKAELQVLRCKENYVFDMEMPLEHAIQQELEPYLKLKSYNIGKHLHVSDFRIGINVIDPLAGMDSFASKHGCLILPFPRHRFKTVPRMLREEKTPKAMWCSGTISEDDAYKGTRSGQVMKDYHIKGALSVEVDTKTNRFHVRQLRYDGTGFYDLDKYYTSDKVTSGHRPLAISCGDDHVIYQCPKAMKMTEDFIAKYKPENIFRHDTLDFGNAGSHHLKGKHLTKSMLPYTLEEELKLTSDSIKKFENLFPFATQYIVASNHPEHLDSYIDEARYYDDYPNHVIGLELALAVSKGENLYKYAMNKYNKLNNTVFLDRKTSLKMKGIELADHGDHGANGSKGTPRQKGIVYSGKSITGHCLTEGHKVNVFGKGFMPIRNVKKGDMVLSYNPETKINEFTEVVDTTYVPNYSGTLVDIGYRGIYKQTVTLNHHFFTRDGEYKSLQSLLTENTPGDIPIYTQQPKIENNLNKGQELMIRLKVAIAADGSVSDNIRFHLSKQRKIERLEWLLNELDLPYSKNETKAGTYKLNILKKGELSYSLFEQMKKDKSLSTDLLREDINVKSIVLDECVYWDGSILSHGSRQFSSTKQHEIQIISSLANELGYKTSIVSNDSVVTFSTRRENPHQLNGGEKSTSKFNVVPYEVKETEVFCLTTKFSNFWVMNCDTGQVSLTGNTHSPEVGVFGNFVNGTLTKLTLPYTKDSGSSSWLNTNTVLYANGTMTHIHIIPD